jgi:hypothetical protein
MRRQRWICVITIVGILLAGRVASAQPTAPSSPPDPPPTAPAVSWTAGALLTSAYVWRGFVIADAASLQPTASVTVGPFTASSWVNYTFSGEGKGFTEHDLTLDYTKVFGTLSVSVGYINYYFPKLDTDTMSHEFYAGVKASGPLSPFVRIYHDVKVGDGTYVNLGVSHEVAVGTTGWTATPAVALGYNRHQWVVGSGWSDLNVGVTVAAPPRRHMAVTGSVNYSHSLNKDWSPNKLFAGLNIAIH